MNQEVQKAVSECVLCWLATVDSEGAPNVSPKEMFVSDGSDQILIANIASPNSVNNIEFNENVCVSFIDIFKQKGFKVKGRATIIRDSEETYHSKLKLLQQLGGEGFPIKNIINISVTTVEPIIAPSYWMFPETTEQTQIEQSMSTYGVIPRS